MRPVLTHPKGVFKYAPTRISPVRAFANFPDCANPTYHCTVRVSPIRGTGGRIPMRSVLTHPKGVFKYAPTGILRVRAYAPIPPIAPPIVYLHRSGWVGAHSDAPGFNPTPPTNPNHAQPPRHPPRP
ncbi:hypothetical protein OZ401_004288 [Candidatus Chlorohelix allophototropha]|uniref:Uncharacterized protein n=1 Tax=Candidatus Chlorohelix allophototropha TaxID=3003348 RepID=A0ABY9B711_9CHLR|nr:hypothetical protein OZ401_004288 [Chloroflexota bacterium L227-S17]